MKMSLYSSKILGTGSYLPEKVLSNLDLEKLVDTSDEWIRERTGILSRRLAAPDQSTSDLATEAAKRAIEASGIEKEEVDLIILCTVSPDNLMPSAACSVQRKLGLSQTPAFDLSAACTGFLYGLTTGDQFIRSGMYKNVLVIGAEVLHRYINYKDRETCILFGDGAGALVLTRTEAEDPQRILGSYLSAEGSLGDLLILPSGGSASPISPETSQDPSMQYIRMRGREIFKHAVRTMSGSCQKILELEGLSMDQVDWLIPHQANRRIMEAVAEHFQFPQKRVVSVIQEMGNTSAATIPVGLDRWVRDKKLQRNQLVLLTAFGAGLTAGSVLLRY